MSARNMLLALMAATVPQALASCAYGTFLQPRAEGGEFKEPTFGYLGANGPAKWSTIAAENSVCATGSNQSPIDLVPGRDRTTAGETLSIDIPDWKAGAEFENLGTTIEVIAPSGSMKIENTTYTLKQFHFHLPSEHLEDGTSMAMEAHFVWQSRENKIAVTGVFLDVEAGGCRAAASQIMSTILDKSNEIEAPGSKVALPDMPMSAITKLFSASKFRNYDGSLTTPPCSEGVDWYVSDQHISIATSTYLKARSVIGFNSRFPQNTPGQPNVLSA